MQEVKVPVLPESVADATVSAWQKQDGDWVLEGEVVAELETDKVMLEVCAPQQGILRVLAQEGSTVLAESVIAKVEPGSRAEREKHQDSKNSREQVADTKEVAPEDAKRQSAYSEPAIAQKPVVSEGTPSERRARMQAAPTTPKGESVTSSAQSAGYREVRKVPMTRMRMKIAERLLSAQHTTASLTTFNEIDMHALMQLRAQHKDAFMEKYGVKLGFMSFFMRSACNALRLYPEVNAFIEEQEVCYHGYCDIGVAVSTDKGLVVPIVRNVERLSLVQIEEEILAYAQKARSNKLELDELKGGTFSITNGGVFGSMLSTPLLNPPQSAILGMHNIVQRPTVVDNKVEIRPIMYVALTYDHRLIDGKQAVGFLGEIKRCIEDPTRLLVEV